MASTMMRGTLLYLAPDPAPSKASDVFALGVTLLDVLFCDGDEERLRQWVLGSSTSVRPNLADLERVRGDLARRTSDTELAALVRTMLAPQPTERPTASAVAEQLAELLDVRTCFVCQCPEQRDKGLECDAEEKHFACDDCFSFHISRREAQCENGGRVKCCASEVGCPATFTFQAAAQHATALAFDTVQRWHIEDMQQQAVEKYEADMAAKSEQERRALFARKHIEEMMSSCEPKCPKCRKIFFLHEGCAAMVCGIGSQGGCGAKFCALCLVDCGSDAHSHVQTCSRNPNPGSYYVTQAQWARLWERVSNEQKREKLPAYWATLEPGVQDALAADASVAQIFRDLKLELGAASYAEQVAQLRGMGFTDERAMRRALGEVGGDVAAAVGLL